MVCNEEQNKNNTSGALRWTGRTAERRQTLETLLLTVPTTGEIPRDAPKLDRTGSVELETSAKIAGYTGGGVQVHEAEERSPSSRWAVGRDEAESLQDCCTNSQSASERPRDSAPRGFLGRSPLITAGTVA